MSGCCSWQRGNPLMSSSSHLVALYVKKIFNLVNNLTGTKQKNPLPAEENLPDKFASFFLEKITKIRNVLDHIPPYKPQPHSPLINNLTDFTPLTEDDVYNLICRSSGKSCKLDPIPGSLLKSMACTLVPQKYHQ